VSSRDARVAGHLARRRERICAEGARAARRERRPAVVRVVADLESAAVALLLAGRANVARARVAGRRAERIGAKGARVADVAILVAGAIRLAHPERLAAGSGALRLSDGARRRRTTHHVLRMREFAEAVRRARAEHERVGIDPARWALVKNGVARTATPQVGERAARVAANDLAVVVCLLAEPRGGADVEHVGLRVDAARRAAIEGPAIAATAPGIGHRTARLLTRGRTAARRRERGATETCSVASIAVVPAVERALATLEVGRRVGIAAHLPGETLRVAAKARIRVAEGTARAGVTVRDEAGAAWIADLGLREVAASLSYVAKRKIAGARRGVAELDGRANGAVVPVSRAVRIADLRLGAVALKAAHGTLGRHARGRALCDGQLTEALGLTGGDGVAPAARRVAHL